MQATDRHSATNRLIHESSPYLLEHAHNPVNWFPWGDEALKLAKSENKPLIISIGYAACHWCHVMEGESFSDEEVASFMNQHFVCIKVDREERPDVDKIYMDAVQILTGSGGWPLNAFALPDGRPFWGGTYFPKENWMGLMSQVVTLYQSRIEDVTEQANALVQHVIHQELGLLRPLIEPSGYKEKYLSLFESWKPLFDEVDGGFGGSPKFVLPAGWQFLMQYHYFTGHPDALKMVELTLSKLGDGGIFDHLAGGFARYSVDFRWLVPHFEKMLYDNAQLLSLYAHAYQVTGNPKFEKIMHQILQFLELELKSPAGGYFASLNADSEGEEGRFYVWSNAELKANLPAEHYRVFADFYNVSEKGNWEEGKNILHRTDNDAIVAARHHISEPELHKIISACSNRLLVLRNGRIRPSTDDKVLTSWNALLIKGLVDTYRAIGDQQVMKMAEETALFIKSNLLKDGIIYRNYKNGKASISGFLDDYAYLADACIELYQVTFNEVWLKLALWITETAIERFSDENGVYFYYSSGDDTTLVARKLELTDNVLPSSNAVMAHNLLRLSVYFEQHQWRNRAEQMVATLAGQFESGGPYYARWDQVLGLLAYGVNEVVVTGEAASDVANRLQKSYLPHALFAGGITEDLPLLRNRVVEGKTLIYVCRQGVCQLPVEHPNDALPLILQKN
jgi:hypothetical protein